MQIWTTPRLEKLLLNKDLPVRISPESEFADEFLERAQPEDVAVTSLSGAYREFLEAAKAKGLAGPFIFISEEQAVVPPEAGHQNALQLSLKTVGIDEAKRIVDFILRTALRLSEEAPQLRRGASLSCNEGDVVLTDEEEIRKALLHPLENSLPLIVSVRVFEEGQPVTVRGICLIREILESSEMILHSFRPPEILKALEPDSPLRIIVPGGDRCYSASVAVRSREEGEIRTSVPDRLFCERTRCLRAESPLSNPVRLHILSRKGFAEEALMIDVSEKGIGFSTSMDLAVGEVYVFSLLFPESNDLLLCYGVIRYRKDAESWMFRYGVELSIQPRDQAVLARYLMERELEVRRLLDEGSED